MKSPWDNNVCRNATGLYGCVVFVVLSPLGPGCLPSAWSASSYSFTQNRREDNNVKYLKAKLGYRKIKSQVPRPWQTIGQRPRLVTPQSSTHQKHRTNSRPFVWLRPSSSIRPPRPYQLIHHVLCVHGHDDASGLLTGGCICLAAIEGRTCCLS